MRTRDKKVILKRFLGGWTVEELATRRVPDSLMYHYPENYDKATKEVEDVIRKALRGGQGDERV